MKKIIVTAALFIFGMTAFCQKEETNGTIYIKHPYIDVVNNSTKAYEAQDWQGCSILSNLWITKDFCPVKGIFI